MTKAVGVAGIIRRGNTILVIRRSPSDTFLPGAWDLPGGGLERDERPEEGIVREVLEETGLRTRVARFLGSRSYLLNSNPRKRDKFMRVYLLEPTGRCKVSLGDEHDAFRWISDSDLGSIFAPKDLMRDVIHDYFQSKQNT